MTESDLRGKEVTIIGGGFAGLSSACYLADKNLDVTILEKNEQIGGRASELEIEGYRFDMGPSWYLMDDVFERFFNHFDKQPNDFYELTHLDPHYRIFFKDGDIIDMPKNLEDAKDIFNQYEENGGETLERYLKQSKKNYAISWILT